MTSVPNYRKYLTEIEAFSAKHLSKASDVSVSKIVLECKNLVLLRLEGSPLVGNETRDALVQVAEKKLDKTIKFFIKPRLAVGEEVKNLVQLADSEVFDVLFYQNY